MSAVYIAQAEGEERHPEVVCFTLNALRDYLKGRRCRTPGNFGSTLYITGEAGGVVFHGTMSIMEALSHIEKEGGREGTTGGGQRQDTAAN